MSELLAMVSNPNQTITAIFVARKCILTRPPSPSPTVLEDLTLDDLIDLGILRIGDQKLFFKAVDALSAYDEIVLVRTIQKPAYKQILPPSASAGAIASAKDPLLQSPLETIDKVRGVVMQSTTALQNLLGPVATVVFVVRRSG